jgi:phage-related protein
LQLYKLWYTAEVAGKPLVWVGAMLDRMKGLPVAARRAGGYQLYRVQIGLDPWDWKPMRSVGPGVIEIRIHAGGEYRVFYVARFEEAVYVLHAFEKRTRQTRETDIELGRRNLAEVLRSRRAK